MVQGKESFLENQGHDIHGREWSGQNHVDIAGFGRDLKDREVK